jgi:hypothetical protein
LLGDRLIVEKDGEYELTAKGWAWSRCFGTFRRLLAMEKGG